MFSAPIIACAHHNKTEAGDALHAISGHNSIPSACQTQIVIKPDADVSTRFTMTCGRSPVMPFSPRKGRWVDLQDPGAADSSGARLLGTSWGMKAELISGERRETENDVTERIARDILVVVNGLDSYGASRKAILAKVPGNDAKKKEVIEHMAGKGLVLVEERGRQIFYKKRAGQ